MNPAIKFTFANDELQKKYADWQTYINENITNSEPLEIRFDSTIPTIIDHEQRKFKIDFLNDHLNYKKIKSGLNKEPLAKALGSGQKGFKLLDLSAGLGVDSIFLQQLGFQVTGLERNPIIYMALKIAAVEFNLVSEQKIEFLNIDALSFLKSQVEKYDVGYFDPMFPDKKKSALPKQEMVIFKNLVGSDIDGSEVVKYVVENKIFKRFVVKRPLQAEAFVKPSGAIEGKIIRYDIYGH